MQPTHAINGPSSPSKSKPVDVARALRLAQQAQVQGQHDQALEHAQAILSRYPGHAGALLLAAQSLDATGLTEQALDALNRLLQLQPRHALARNNRGVALDALGDHERALLDYEAALRVEPQYLDALLNRAQCLLKLQQPEKAQAAYEAILQVRETIVEAHLGLAQVLQYQREEAGCLNHLQRAVELDPQDGQAWYLLGNGLLDFLRHEEAVEAYGQASTLLPGHALTYSNCAKALRELGRHDEALLVCEAALSLDPACEPALRNKSVFLLDLQRWVLAVEACAKALQRMPQDAQTHNNLGFALTALRQYPAALDAYQTATRHDPSMAIAWINQACTLELMHRHDEGLACYERVLALQPDYPNLMGRLGFARSYVCDWTGAQALREELLQRMHAGEAPCDPFRIISFSDRAQDQQQLARRWLQELPPPAPGRSWEWPPRAVRHSASRRIRVGYFSADFHHHATTLLMAQLLEQHDRNRFELVAYSFGERREDAMRQRVQKCFDAWHEITNLDDDQAADLARSHQLDIAVDLKGHTMDHRLGIFQRRVAPVQVSYLGFPGTLGAPFMDYIVADHTVIPDELRSFYDEKVIRVPGTYQANDASRAVDPVTPSRSSLGLPEKGFVFCCFNNNYKITPAVFDIWMRLLKAVPGSVLWLLADNATARGNLLREAAARGVAADRLVFAPRTTIEEHLPRQRAADLFLDTLPCNAHTTASDALRVGLPVLTCTGTSFASRVAANLLMAQGLPELVTPNLVQYESMALSLAQNPGQLAALRHRAVEAITAGRMLNTPALACHLERAYAQIHEWAEAGLAPQHLDIGT